VHLPQLGEHRREQPGRGHREGAEAHPTSRPCGRVRDGRVEVRDDPGRPRQQPAASRGQRHPHPVTVEDPLADRGFEGRDLTGHGGLGVAEVRRRPGEAAPLRHRHQHPQARRRGIGHAETV
jgi:hypothetical protein